MKPVLIVLLFFSGTACCLSQTGSSEAELNLKKMKWLVGTWNRTNISKPGRTFHERWEEIGEHRLRGYGVTMQGQDTVFLEKITILIKENNLYYVADVPDNKHPVYFKLTSVNDSGFVCENPEHDFPKKIVYQFDGATLKAQISGDEKSIDYLFEKQ